ncbi:MAG: hypothetical protein JHC95_22085, partial [Solirubrobacteraceae bacterium]|nr:hypothetical protein [Solirubrobacteraceae bacterium]
MSGVEEPSRYEVYLRVSDDDDDAHLYLIEHWFVNPPEAETVAALFEEAKRTFA